MVIFDRIGPHKVAVTFSNGALLGDLVRSEDGYFYWWPPDCTQGAWQGYILRSIADKLEELNAERDEMVRREIKEPEED
mgnify:CR=1 FL=1